MGLPRINKIGLIPKSNNNAFDYPEKTHFYIGDIHGTVEVAEDLDRARTQYPEHVKHEQTPHDYAIYQLLTDKIPTDAKFYIDEFSFSSVYTYDNIAPTALKHITNIRAR